MPTEKQITSKAAWRSKRPVHIIGFATLSNGAVHVRVPDATYLLSADAWAGLMQRGRAWGTELSRVLLENEMGAYSVRWLNEKGLIIIDDQAECRRLCIREDDLAGIQPGQHLPVYGKDNGAWKYNNPTYQAIEKVFSPLAVVV